MLAGDKEYMIPSPVIPFSVLMSDPKDRVGTPEHQGSSKHHTTKYNCQDLKQTSPRRKTQATHILLNAAERRPQLY